MWPLRILPILLLCGQTAILEKSVYLNLESALTDWGRAKGTHCFMRHSLGVLNLLILSFTHVMEKISLTSKTETIPSPSFGYD